MLASQTRRIVEFEVVQGVGGNKIGQVVDFGGGGPMHDEQQARGAGENSVSFHGCHP